MDKKTLARFRFLFILVALSLVLLTTRVAYLQIANYDHYVTRSERNRVTKLPVHAPRGEIYDRNDQLLVTNQPGFVLSLMDMGGGYDSDTIAFLAEKLELEEEEIREKIRRYRFTRYMPVQLKEDISEETMAEIYESRWKLQGISIEPQPIREYKFGVSGAHLFGYLGLDEPRESINEEWTEQGYEYRTGERVGQARGLEEVWEPYLRGEDGEQLVETNYLGQPQNYLDREEPVPGKDLYLTLDTGLQEVATSSLKEMVDEIQEEEDNEEHIKGAVVVLDPNTGAIMAMHNYPSYDPNTVSEDIDELKQDPRQPFNNTAISGTYPIGSTFKMITGIAALEEGEITDQTSFNCQGVLDAANTTKSCHSVHGSTSIYRGIAESCNIFFYQAGLRAGIDAIAHYSREFGLGVYPGLEDIRGETRGTVASREEMEKRGRQWHKAETMDAAIGQTLHDYSPMQMAQYVSMIANGGVHYRPYLVDRVYDYQGETVKEVEPEILREADVSSETLDIIREGMKQTVGPGGTANYAFRNVEEEVAAKTGTAEPSGDSSSHGLFVAYGPYEDPDLAVAVLVEHGSAGATSAAPVAADIMEYYFDSPEGD